MIVWTYEKQQQLEQMRAEGKTIEQIAFHFRLSPYTICQQLHIQLAQPYDEYNAPLPEFSTIPFREEDYWDKYGHLSDEELTELEILWEELKF